MLQRQDACNGLAELGGNSNTDFLSHAGHEILKPFERLRWEVVPRPSQPEQSVQLLEQQRATARFIGEGFPLRPTDLSLDAILMKSLMQRIETGVEIKPMEMVRSGTAEVAVEIQEGIRGSYFHIFPPFLLPQ
jgi:hypothetical protein